MDDSASDFPPFAFVVLALGFAIVIAIRIWNPDLSYDLLIELSAAAFLIIVVGWAITYTKRKQWGAVKEQTEYLIARAVHSIRYGVAVRAFNFDPAVDAALSDEENEGIIRSQRSTLLDDVLSSKDVRVHPRLWDEAAYFDQRAQDVWSLVNMKNGNFSPEVTSLLQDLYVHLEDLQSHIRTHARSADKKKQVYYRRRAEKGAKYCLREIIRVTSALRDKGYFEPARVE